jgi:hypothetical protein
VTSASRSVRALCTPRTGLAPSGLSIRMEVAVIEPASRRKQNPKQVALLPANALISHRIVPPLRPVSSHLVPFYSPLEGHTGGTCDFPLQTLLYGDCLFGTIEGTASKLTSLAHGERSLIYPPARTGSHVRRESHQSSITVISTRESITP